MEDDAFDDALGELKRADHLIFVSLKYTRTCDVIMHIVERLANAIEMIFTIMLENLKEENKIEEVPKAPIPKAKVIKENYPDDELIQNFTEFFLHLRKIKKAEFTRAREFRRHVTMTSILPNDEMVEINIDIITDYFKSTKEFLSYVRNMLE